MRPVSSASGMNDSGGTSAARRVLPAEQRLHADDPPGREARRSAGSGAGARSAPWRAAGRARASPGRAVWACISGSNRTVDRIGSAFARWSAISACLSRSPGYVTRRGPTAMPEARPDEPRGRRGRTAPPMAASIRVATRSASRMLRTGPSRIPNSSEPSRATVSVDRAAPSSRRPTSTRSRSPAAWPRLSLTTLNRSRSRRISATRVVRPRAGDRPARRVARAAPRGG